MLSVHEKKKYSQRVCLVGKEIYECLPVYECLAVYKCVQENITALSTWISD